MGTTVTPILQLKLSTTVVSSFAGTWRKQRVSLRVCLHHPPFSHHVLYPLRCQRRGWGENKPISKPYFLSCKGLFCQRHSLHFHFQEILFDKSLNDSACQWRGCPVTTCSPYYLKAVTRVQSKNCLSLHINCSVVTSPFTSALIVAKFADPDQHGYSPCQLPS